MSGQIPVTFPNREGLKLFGILHQPEQPRPGLPAILLLSPGVKTRVAPHRLYKKMAEQFAALGHPVLRFDFHGLGDSEGELTEGLLTELYGTIQLGRYVDDTIAAMDWMQATHGVSRFVAAGLCGGAITGLLAGARDSRIQSLLALAIPAIVEGPKVDASKYMTVGQLTGIRDMYFRKLSPASGELWQSLARFLTFRSDYRLLFGSLVKPLMSRLRRPAAPEPQLAASQPDDNTNPHFAPALFHMMGSSRRVLFVFAGTDRLHWEFEAKFLRRHQERLAGYAEHYDIHVTSEANHIFSLREWQDDMLEQCRRWLGGQPLRQAALIAGAKVAV